MSRGYRNNNPSNIKKNNIEWEGLSDVQDDDVFYKFTDIVYGIRAFFVILFNYNKLYKLDTIRKILNRFAPSCENPTSNYVDFVCDKVGIGADEIFDFTNKDNMLKLAQAIFTFENGEAYNDIDSLKRGLSMAINKMRK